jgi:hypothetical protein
LRLELWWRTTSTLACPMPRAQCNGDWLLPSRSLLSSSRCSGLLCFLNHPDGLVLVSTRTLALPTCIAPDTYQGGRHAEANQILAQITGKNLSIDDPAVTSLKRDIDEAIALEVADGPWKFTECFKSGPLKIRRRFILAICMFYRIVPSLIACI